MKLLDWLFSFRLKTKNHNHAWIAVIGLALLLCIFAYLAVTQ